MNVNKEEEGQGTSPTTRSFSGRQWPGGTGLRGGGVCARERRCMDVHACRKGEAGLDHEFIKRGRGRWSGGQRRRCH
jgi:hypothetical protein